MYLDVPVLFLTSPGQHNDVGVSQFHISRLQVPYFSLAKASIVSSLHYTVWTLLNAQRKSDWSPKYWDENLKSLELSSLVNGLLRKKGYVCWPANTGNFILSLAFFWSEPSCFLKHYDQCVNSPVICYMHLLLKAFQSPLSAVNCL